MELKSIYPVCTSGVLSSTPRKVMSKAVSVKPCQLWPGHSDVIKLEEQLGFLEGKRLKERPTVLGVTTFHIHQNLPQGSN